MKAAVCYELGKPLKIAELDIDAPKRGEVKVRLGATAICHSDVHFVRGDWGGKLPVLAGHETAGIVEEVGEDVADIKAGDSVIVSLLRTCGHCFYCENGQRNHCDGKFALQREYRIHTKAGEKVYAGMKTGGFAEQVVVDQSQVVHIPSDLPLDVASLLACGVITGVGAVVNTAQVKPGSSVVIIGAGGVGLNAVQGARLAGASRIIAVDLVDMKLDAARMFGATDTINAKDDEAQQKVKELTSGRGADYVLITVGSTAAVSQGFGMLRRAGTLVIVGMPTAGATLALPMIRVAEYGYKVLGSFMGDARLHVDIPWLITLYQQGRLKLDELITARYPVEQVNEAMENMEQGKALRNIIIW